MREVQDFEEKNKETKPHRERSDRPVTERRGSWWFFATAIGMAILLGLGSLGLLWILGRAIAVFILGITLAAAVYPVVRWLARYINRILAVVVVYILLFAIIGGIIWLVVPPLVNQITNFSKGLPNLIDKIQATLNNLGILGNVSLSDVLTSSFNNLGSTIVSFPVTVISSLFDVVVIIFLSVYALIDLPEIGRFVNSLVPFSQERDLDALLARMARSMGGYVRGAIINGLIIGTLTYFGFFLIGVNFPLILSLIAGSLELIPVIGPLIAAVPALIIAFSQSTTLGLITLVYMLAMHQLEGHILVPNIMRSQTEVTQLFIIIALFAGYSVGGILGSLAAIPLAAGAWVFFDEIVTEPVRKQTGAPPEKDELMEEAEEAEE
jgi:predicted PurR-regulated permease PerM